ncbi:glycerophosphodiester phosphodiesterase family protein [Weissella sagaensis]|uniref:Glycerophosphodiester phosphodiesterase family protein n=1 Tax=Weissella sagaensis TaxID=2559928 RepID=A0ABW1RSD9_9LACO|nr:glycerophosphodiester phosphodiesterase family protein [Weissella sagaensis]QDJ58192.1 glycerophosphodiester phosphodiesterase [Weissella hellenica]QEA57186.1 glycerophosphodiester phosphodiesterase [Weissella hellenica]
MNNHYLKQTTLMMMLLLVYNYIASVSIGYINDYLPPAYQLDTSGVSALLSDLKANGLQYGMSMLGYFLVYLVFVILLIGVILYHYHKLSIKTLLHNMHRIKIYVFTFILLLILLPLNQVGLKVPVINYIPIPETFIGMISGFWLKVIAAFVYIGIVLVLLRFKDSMYYLVVADDKLKNALTKSWHRNSHQLSASIMAVLRLVGQLLISVGVLMGLQYLVDQLGNSDFSTLMVNVLTAFLMGMLYFITAEVLLLFTTNLNPRIGREPAKITWLLTIATMGATGGLSLSLANRFIQQPMDSQLVMAHMGVTSKNDAQNAIENLEKVSATKPDYVEIDIQHTKDGVYVLSHDAKITALNGQKYKISETNWSELKNISYDSNGHKVSVSNFGDYLNKANELNQKLLIELKINSSISNQELKDFSSKYGQAIKQNKAQIQSLNQNALKRLSDYINATSGLLSPLNNTINRDKSHQFYALEYSSVVPKTSDQAHQVGKKLYAWTVDGHVNIMTMYAYGVDGFITDEPKKTRAYLTKIKKQPNYALVLWKSMMFTKNNF